MYEMYPQAWAQESVRRPDAERPRRRPRRPHPVLPAVIARQLESPEPGRSPA